MLRSYAVCTECNSAFHVVGELSDTLFVEFSKRLQCPKCPGNLVWDEFFRGYAPTLSVERFYRIVLGVESLHPPPYPEVAAAMLLTYRVQDVVLYGKAIKEIRLGCGISLHLSVSREGAYVNALTKEGED